MSASDIGIDLGTSNSVVYSTGKGIVLKEPSVVAYNKDTQKIRAIGEEARLMEAHPTSNLEIVYPIRQGTVEDYNVMEKMLKHFIQKAQGRRAFRKPRISICIPDDIKEIEKRALEEATYQAGARRVYLVQAPVAAAIGAGIDITRPFGNMIVNIGGGSTCAAVLSLAGVVVSSTIKTGGINFNQAIVSYLRKNHSLFISEEQAEVIKYQIGVANEQAEVRTMDVKGRNIITGLPKTAKITSEEMRTAFHECIRQIQQCVHSVLERTPPELMTDIVERGIVLAGGGALLDGMEKAIEEYTGIQTTVCQEPMLVTAVGTGKYAELFEKLDK